MATETRLIGRGRVYESITDTIGDTPIVRLRRLAKEKDVKAELLAKLEFFNPIASVKDRIGVCDDRRARGAGQARARARRASSSRPPATPASRSPSSRRRAATSSSS